MIAAFFGLVAATQAQPLMQSQVICNTNEILDERGIPLVGNAETAAWFGQEPVLGARVQVLRSDNGIIHPPLANGDPDPRNPLLKESQIGAGISPHLPASGHYSAAVTPRPAFNSTIFVRVFNRPTVEESSFYGDSPLFSISPIKHEVFHVNVNRVDRPIDDGDSDSDGIRNSWEKTLGVNPLLSDSDGDGMSDLYELVSGSNPMDDTSFLEVETIYHPSGASVSLSWQSVADRLYRIEAGNPQDPGAAFEEIRQVPGTGGTMVETLTDVNVDEPKWYRIKAESLVPLPFN